MRAERRRLRHTGGQLPCDRGVVGETYIKEKCVGDPAAEVCIVPEDVAALLALLKIARIATGHGKSDNWVDLAGYAACGGELQSRPAVCGK